MLEVLAPPLRSSPDPIVPAPGEVILSAPYHLSTFYIYIILGHCVCVCVCVCARARAYMRTQEQHTDGPARIHRKRVRAKVRVRVRVRVTERGRKRERERKRETETGGAGGLTEHAPTHPSSHTATERERAHTQMKTPTYGHDEFARVYGIKCDDSAMIEASHKTN